MKIRLIKVGKIPLDFEEKSNKITFKGSLQYDTNKLILLKAKLSGNISVDCNICAGNFDLDIAEDIEFYLHSGIYSGLHDELLDVVECLDDIADLSEILNSEIELIKSDYNTCKNCK